MLRIFALFTHDLTARDCAALCRAADASHAVRYRSHEDVPGAKASLAANVLLRYAASRVLDVPMTQVTTAAEPSGRPILPGTGLHCSVSHSDGLCVCAVADAPVGIDTERLRAAPLRVAQRVFSALELRRLDGADDPDRVFFEIWTKRESAVKLTGAGLRDISGVVPDNVRTRTFLFAVDYAVSVSTFTDTT
ncbi:MAG: 4'-phosphopantetheinyl transferase superfamily protein [Clostridia bacterium]|nr:4'-phosphopantetheinyl transferase superfamily protein [Clostridia bacterium]